MMPAVVVDDAAGVAHTEHVAGAAPGSSPAGVVNATPAPPGAVHRWPSSVHSAGIASSAGGGQLVPGVVEP